MNAPENHVVAEGRSLRAALEDAAAKLGVPVSQVDHKIDLAHFRSATGAGVGSETVKIMAWAKDLDAIKPALAAEAWMRALLEQMERTGTVRAEMRGGAAVIHVDVGEAGRHLVGRGGATLKALQHLLEQSVGKEFPGTPFRIDVARAEEGEERREERGERGGYGERDRGDRGGYGERGRDRGDRGPREARGDRDRGGDRGRGRDRDRGGDRGDRPRRSDADVEDLKRLARKLAEKVLDTGNPETIRRELNSFERRMVHVEIAAISGVASRSIGEGADRRIQILPASGAKDEGEAGEE